MASKVEMSGLSVISEDKTSARKYHDAREDCESVYNPKSRSAYNGGHKKKLHPLLLGPNRRDPGRYVGLHAASKSNLSEFTQRIMSAKLLRVKQVQNQLTETQIQLNELINENRILRNLQKRQEGALKKYEGNHAELPQLIRSHNEEIRTLKANNKLIKAQLREANNKLKDRENELENLKENYIKLKKLSGEKNLLEREKLQKKVEDLQEIIKEQDEKIQVLSRKILLESKNYRHHLNIEISKHKETRKDLNNALAMINKLESQLLAKEKMNVLAGVPGRLPYNRSTLKNMPTVTDKALENRTTVGDVEQEDADGEDSDSKERSPRDSPSTDSELLNNLISSDDTPSPTQDIFPEIVQNCDVSTSETFQLDCNVPGKHCSGFKSRKTPLPNRNCKTSSEIQEKAKMISEKLTDDVGIIEKGLNVTNSLDQSRIDSLHEEVKSKSSKLDFSNEMLKKERELEETTRVQITDIKRNVPKRKLEDEKKETELTEPQQQKLISMSKTWNDIKDKIQEERKKAEEKMKELCKTSRRENSGSGSDSDPENVIDSRSKNNEIVIEKQEIIIEENVTNLADDDYILNELEKTDKMFKKLTKPSKRTKTPVLGNKSNIVEIESMSYRTESKRDPKFLREFQAEQQKQNLLKKLKAIDVGKDPNLASDEESDEETENVKRMSSCSNKSKSDLISELFGPSPTRLDKNDNNIKMEYGITARED